jgi:hypothetical protein
MLPASWKPVQSGNLVRLGSESDGGYVVALTAVQASRLLISLGLSDNWDFEADFRARSEARVICHDHTVDCRFWLRHAVANLLKGRLGKLGRFFAYRRFFSTDDVQHHLLKVGYDGPGSTSLRRLIEDEPVRSVFLKADIEGSEYRIFDDIVAYADRLTGIAIELHDIDLHRHRIDELFRQMSQFRIVALSANNFGGVDANGDPLVIEVTLIRSDLLDSGKSQPLFKPVANDPRWPAIEPRFAATSA